MINHDAPPLPVQATPHRSRNTKQPTPITKITQITRKSQFRQPTTTARSGNPSPKQKHQTTNTQSQKSLKSHENHSSDNPPPLPVQATPHRSRNTKQPTPITKIIQIIRKSQFRQRAWCGASRKSFKSHENHSSDNNHPSPSLTRRSTVEVERGMMMRLRAPAPLRCGRGVRLRGVLMPCFSIALRSNCLTGLCHRRSRPRHRRRSSSPWSAPAPRSG